MLNTYLFPSILRLVWVISPRNGEIKKADSTLSIHAHNAINGTSLDYHALLEILIVTVFTMKKTQKQNEMKKKQENFALSISAIAASF